MTFDEAMNESLIDVQDLYLIERNLGTFTFPAIVQYDAETFSVGATFNTMPEGDYSLVILSGEPSFEDIFGNDFDGENNLATLDATPTGDGEDGGIFSFDFRLDNPTIVSSDQFTLPGPHGSLARHFNVTDRISFEGDVDSYQFELGIAETFDLELNSHNGENVVSVVVTDNSRNIVAEATASGPGEAIRLETQRARLDGTYTVFVSGTTIDAPYDLEFTRNATTERTDSSPMAPISIDRSLTSFGVDRLSVVGSFEPTATPAIVWGVQPASGQIVMINPSNGNVIGSFQAPDGLAATHTKVGLTLAEGSRTLLYVNSDIDASLVYRLDPSTGEVKSTESVANVAHSGLASNRGAVFVSRDGVDVQRQILGSAPIDDWTIGQSVTALGGDDSGRVFGLFVDGKLHEFDSATDSDTLLSSFDAPAENVEGLAFDGTALYAATADGRLFTLNPDSGEIQNQILVPGGALFGLAGQTSRSNSEPVVEEESNNSRNRAQPIDEAFSLEFDANIGNSAGENTSTTVPHATILGTGNGSVDFYSFTVSQADSVGIFDIDSTENMDAYLRLFDSRGNQVFENDDFSNDPGSDTSLDSFIEFTFTAAGEYFVEVGTCCTAQPVNSGESYQLHVSIENHPTTILQEFELISEKSIWKYWDQGTQPGLIWPAPAGVDESTWSEGRGELGYGDGDENTVVSFGPDESNKHATTYFRHTFKVQDRSLITALRAELLRDDGAAVYLNGQEVIRDRLALGAGNDALATGGAVQGSNERTYHDFTIDPSLLVDGNNVLAVEVHQHSRDSDDLSFDLRLIAETRLTLDAFATTPDLDEYQVALKAGETIDIGLSGAGIDGNSRLTLYDATGIILLAESDDSTVEPSIRGFTAADDAVYVVRATSDAATQYGLLVTRDAAFHSTDDANLQTLDTRGGVAGTIRSGGASSAVDPEGDHQSSAQEIDADIASVNAVVEDDLLVITVQFHNDTILGSQPDGSDATFGLIEIDIDQDSSTGAPSLLAQVGVPGQPGGDVGVERQISFNTSVNAAIVVDPNRSGCCRRRGNDRV